MSLKFFAKCSFIIYALNLSNANAGNPINLSLESAVEIAISNSYRFRMLKLEIEKSILKLEAEKAGLKNTNLYESGNTGFAKYIRV